jgi:Tfp pilus assembly protein PilF
MTRLLLGAALVAMLAACESQPVREMQASVKDIFQPSKGQAMLNTGLRQYEEGNYPEAATNVQRALDQGLSERERVIAHKHLAFIHCASGRERQCRDEFRRALAVNPGLELTPAEAGHPAWGPVFRSVRAGR